MQDYQHIWRFWAEKLHLWGLGDFIAAILEVCGPLSLLGAQFVYLTQPLLNEFVSDEALYACTSLLEDEKNKQRFVTLLRDDSRI